MMYRKSDKLLGVWVTRPLLSKKGIAVGNDTKLEGVVDAGYLQNTYEFYDGRRKILGKPDGDHNYTKVEIKPVWIGWTRDAGKSFITDEDLIATHGKTTVGKALKDEGYVATIMVLKGSGHTDSRSV